VEISMTSRLFSYWLQVHSVLNAAPSFSRMKPAVLFTLRG
jgi:hypothetical protein